MTVGCLRQKDLGKIIFRAMSVVLYLLGHHSNMVLCHSLTKPNFQGLTRSKTTKVDTRSRLHEPVSK
jgi:hypothetical protein